jgi:hypothetical protein
LAVPRDKHTLCNQRASKIEKTYITTKGAKITKFKKKVQNLRVLRALRGEKMIVPQRDRLTWNVVEKPQRVDT